MTMFCCGALKRNLVANGTELPIWNVRSAVVIGGKAEVAKKAR